VRTLGAHAWQATLGSIRAEIAIRSGDMRGAAAHADSVLSMMSADSWGVRIGLPLSGLVRAYTEMGNHQTAGELLKRPVPEAMFETRFGLHFRHARGRYYVATGLLRAALSEFRACGEAMQRWGIDQPALVPWRSEAAQVHLLLGEQAEARALVDEQLARVDGSRSRTCGISLRTSALTRDVKARPKVLRESIEILQESGDRLEMARALTDLSQTYSMLKDYSRARTLMRRASNIAKDCHAELRAVPDMPVVVGNGPQESVLSEAERRVATMAGAGHTNREIARTLYITVSTVEQHLTKVFRKLSVTRRTELPRLVARD
jgi:DNA-binding CsgD family transcriptional regulator